MTGKGNAPKKSSLVGLNRYHLPHFEMSFSEYLTSAVNTLASVPPSRLAAVMSGAVGFLAAFALLPGADSDAPAGNQQIIVWAGSLITAFLASQLAAYLLRIAEHRPSWPNLSSPRKLAVTLILALVSAGIVLGLMLLVS